MDKFEIKEEHLKLLEHLLIDSGGDVPAANWKRPYGNSDVTGDVLEILGWEPEGDSDEPFDSEYSDEQIDLARKLHRETSTALQICLIHKEFKPGIYVNLSIFNQRTWRKVEDGKVIFFEGDV